MYARAMAEQEGTIQFAYNLEPLDGPLPEFRELHAWRKILFDLGLVGQQSDRYQGYGFGNMSVRHEDGFAITASQTSGLETLEAEHLVNIAACNLDRFWVEARGSEPPSSETVTHAMIYAADKRTNWVFHVHSPDLWQRRESLGLPSTGPDVPYGSQAMVSAVAELLATHQSRPLLFATEGHEDGIFCLAGSARDCGGLLVTYFAKALSLQDDK